MDSTAPTARREAGSAAAAAAELPWQLTLNPAAENAFRRKNWSATKLGAVTQWPSRLVQVLTSVLCVKVPNLIVWGSQDMTVVHNESFGDLMGDHLGNPCTVFHLGLFFFIS